MQATIGPQGGELAGAKGSALEGVKLVVPAGALASDTRIAIKAASTDAALPAGTSGVGKQIQISPAGLQLALPAQLTLPVDASQVEANLRFAEDVKVWVQDEAAPFVAPQEQINTTTGMITMPGDRTAKAPDGYLWEPALYIAPETAQNGGTPHFPSFFKGSYNNNPNIKGVTATVPGMDPPPPGAQYDARCGGR